MKNKPFLFFSAIAMALVVLFCGAEAYAQTFSPVAGGTMKVGSRGTNVSAVQRLLASNADLYPSGRVTGYFGPLTREAVIQFQIVYDLTPDGIVGPMTRAKMNSVIAMGRGLDIYAPGIANVNLQTSGRTMAVGFTSNEPVRANVYYDRNPLSLKDSGLSFGLPIISGAVVADPTYGTTKQLTITNLNADTTYNYSIMAVDPSGNVRVILPQVFRSGS
jgi:peptidoglycan hydrolase-like protein with peptidoglycan-binding domain